MNKLTLSYFYNKIYILIDKISNVPHWMLKTSIALLILSFIFSPPYSLSLPFELTPENINKCKTCSQQYKWGVDFFTLQFKSPLTIDAQDFLKDKPHEDGFVSHLDKRWSRITVPVIAWIFHLNMIGVYLLQIVLLPAFLFYGMKYLLSVTGDKTLAFCGGVSLGCIYLSKTFIGDFIHYDCFAFFFLLMAAYQKRPFWSVPFLILAAFVDERAVISFPLFYLLRLIGECGVALTFNDILKKINTIFPFVFSFLIYSVLRFYLKKHLQIHDEYAYSYMGWGRIDLNLKSIPLSLFATLEATLGLIIIPAVMSIVNRNFLFSFLYIIGVLASLAAAFWVADLSRSINYVFPSIFISLIFLHKTENIKIFRFVSVSVMLFCLFFPTHDFALAEVGGQSWILPIFYKIIHLVF